MTLQPNLSNSLITKLLPTKMFVICIVMIHYSRDNLWSNLSFGTKSRAIILSIIKLEFDITVIVITVFFTEFDFPSLRYTFYVYFIRKKYIFSFESVTSLWNCHFLFETLL